MNSCHVTRHVTAHVRNRDVTPYPTRPDPTRPIKDFPPLTRPPQGGLVLEPVPQLSLWSLDKLNSESQLQTARTSKLADLAAQYAKEQA